MNAIHLVGSSIAALAAFALTSCGGESSGAGNSLGQPRVELAHSSIPGQPASPKAVMPSTDAAAPGRGAGLPVKDGLWADKASGGCSGMAASDPAFIIADDMMMFVLDMAKLTPAEPLSAGRWRTGSKADYDEQTIRIASAEEITVEQGTVTGSFVWCSAETEWEPWFAE